MQQTRKVLALQCLLVFVLAVAAAAVLMVPFPLDEPVAWGGDSLEHAVLVDSANWLGEPGYSTETGAPHGVDWAWAPSGGERANLAAISVLKSVTGDLWVALSLHLLAVVGITAVAAFAVVRWLGASSLLAGAAGLVFALTSPVYDHIEEGHLFLFGLYPVPLAVYLACRWTGWNPGGGHRSARDLLRDRSTLAATIVSVLAVALSSTYYALFAVLLVGMLAVLVAIRRLDWRAAVPGIAVAASIGLVLVLSSLPALLSGDAPRLDRKLSDSTRFALDPIQSLLPQRENLFGVADTWGASPSEAVGLVAAAGLAWLGWVLLRHLGRGDGRADGLMLRLAALVALSLAVGVPGGLGWLIARFGAQELRAWSRVSVFIAFVGVAVLAVLVTRAVTRAAVGTDEGEPAAARGLLAGTVVVVLLALLGQRSMLPDRQHVQELRAEAAVATAALEEALAQGSSVLVWPAGSYLSDFGPGQVLAPPVLGDTLEYSSGSFRGGPGDWQLTWALEDVDSQLEAAAAAGFDAVLVDGAHHLLGDVDGFAESITAVAGDPAGSAGSWQWWLLDDLRSELAEQYGAAAVEAFGANAVRPLGIVVDGTPGFPSTGRERDYALGAEGSIAVRSHDADDAEVVVAFEVVAAPDSTVTLSTGADSRTLTPGRSGDAVVVSVDLLDGHGEILVTTDGRPLRRAGADPAVYAELRDVQAFDAALASSPVVVPKALG